MEIISRKEAKEKGLKRYFTGKSCKNGHLAEKYVINHGCVNCKKEWKNNNLEKVKNSNKESRKRNYYKHRNYNIEYARLQRINNSDYIKQWYIDNRDNVLEHSREWYKNNKAKARETRKNYVKRNKQLYRFFAIKRLRQIRCATPKWINLEKVKQIYLNCPKNMEVDHIIPIQGRNVCGLHVENNLQYLSKSENCSKNNKFIIEGE